MQAILLAYCFMCFVVGIACLGLNLMSARRRGDSLSRAFLVFYAALSLLVLGVLLRTFFDLTPGLVSPTTVFAVEYTEAFLGRYGVMFSLPFFAHRVFAVSDHRRDWVIIAIVLAAFLGQHVTEFWLSKAWDERGDVFEDVLMAAFGVYALSLGIARAKAPGVYRPMAVRFLALMTIALPGVAYDLFLSGDSQVKFFPLFYCVGSVITTLCLVHRAASVASPLLLPEWGLSNREAEVAALVQRGCSNREVAEQLNISTNTVKTHLRAVFEKSGLKSRFELISAGRQESAMTPGSSA